MSDWPPRLPDPASPIAGTPRWRRKPVVLAAVLGVGALAVIGAVVEPGTDTAADAPTGVNVTHVVDGDTVDVSSGDRIRLIGIDTPERGECGFDEATRRVEQLVDGASITLVPGARDDIDHYGRLLRYVEADGVDVGLTLLEEGLAISRYDSRDGYGAHTRERTYHLADNSTEQICGAPAAAQPQVVPTDGVVYFENCAAARAAGAAPLFVGDPGYRGPLDRDKDGVACE